MGATVELDQLIERYHAGMMEAIRQVERALTRWRNRQEVAAHLTSKMDKYTKSQWLGQDQELRTAMDDYGFWQREVVRFSAQVQGVVAIQGRRRSAQSIPVATGFLSTPGGRQE